jgi:hypothetical protein
MALEDIEYINFTLNQPDTQWEIWDKVNNDFAIFYASLATLEAEFPEILVVDGGEIT